MIKIIAATGNKNKIREFQEILGPYGFKITTFKEEGLEEIEVVEDGDTFEENSYKKAFEIMSATGYGALADDSGLEVDFLDGAPGVYSARFAGDGHDDKANNNKLIEIMKDVPVENRGCQFASAITLLTPEGIDMRTKGIVRGILAFEERGEGGFGYDPLFIPEGFDRTFAELEAFEKNAISHRGEALKLMVKELKNKL